MQVKKEITQILLMPAFAENSRQLQGLKMCDAHSYTQMQHALHIHTEMLTFTNAEYNLGHTLNI